ncbi:hypothetical protein LTR53_020016, partial [Teratosphaeriaceae sp. CCFEE 6253]
ASTRPHLSNSPTVLPKRSHSLAKMHSLCANELARAAGGSPRRSSAMRGPVTSNSLFSLRSRILSANP